MANNNKKFAKPSMIIDQRGSHDDVLNYQAFYDNEVKTITDNMHLPEFDSMGREEKTEMFLSQVSSCYAEKEWFNVHNPAFKITDDVVAKIEDIELPEMVDSMLLPFSSYLVIFPKNEFRFTLGKRGIQNMDGVLVNANHNFINFTFYISNKGGCYNTSDVVDTDYPITRQMITDTNNPEHKLCEELFCEVAKKALKIGYIASSEILTEKDEKTLVTKVKNREPNTTVITDFKCTDYKRYLKPIWDNMSDAIGNATRELHYQFTRKAHKRTVRYGKGRMFSKVVEIAQTLVRPDLPRKAELMTL
jgi:hypothetical protein